LQHVAGLPRDFDILSNKYREAHEDKVQLEREFQRRQAAQKYWETHDFDPLTLKYIHPAKEEAYLEQQRQQDAKQPMKQFNRLPPSLQKGEGFVYDITTHVVKNKELYDRKKASEQQWFESRAASWKRNEEIRDRSAVRQQLDDARAVNRAAHKRYVEKFQYGYDIVDHRDFRDPDTYMPPPRTRPQLSVWEAVGPNRPPPPPPPQPPPPMNAPLLSTIPPSGSIRTGGFQRAAAEPAAAEAAAD